MTKAMLHICRYGQMCETTLKWCLLIDKCLHSARLGLAVFHRALFTSHKHQRTMSVQFCQVWN